MPEATVSQQRRLIDALQQALSRTGTSCEVIETHISWVLLAGEFAYKIKKAVNFGFLDYSTLERRQGFCLEEVRLNRRTAPELYLEAVPIGGRHDHPLLGEGEPVEWAVKMRRFDQAALLDRRLAADLLTSEDMEQIADALAQFHSAIPAIDRAEPYGDPEAVYQPVVENFPAIQSALGRAVHPIILVRHSAWAARQFEALRPRMAARKQQGYVRECHGDLHLSNLVQLERGVVPFDAVEFNPFLRWIDVANELAFIAMDLEARGHGDLAHHLVNAYLERTGDYDAVPLLDFYKHYRAMVRAKVAALRYAQTAREDTARLHLLEEFGAYLILANSYTQPSTPTLILTSGVAGSGKTRVAGALVDHLPRAVRIRSDVERKRLFGLAPQARSGSTASNGIYSPHASVRTYERLAELAIPILEAGYVAVVDATFLRRTDRENFRRLAQARNLPFLMLAVTAPAEMLRERVRSRYSEGRDASEADLSVLEKQLTDQEPLTPEEMRFTLAVDTGNPWEAARLVMEVEKRIGANAG